MAGLLDFFGNGWEDPKSNAIMALAGGLLDGDFAGGMKGYSGVMAGAGEAKFKRQLQQAQMDKYIADTEMDKQKLSLSQGKEKRDSDFETVMIEALKRRQLGGGVAMPNMPVTGSQDGMQGTSQGGMPSGGQSFGGDPFAGIDSTALMLDYRNNGGKNMGGWVNDRTKPDMAVTDGYAWDKNRTSAGFMPFLRTDASGKTSMGQIGGNGLPVVSAPQGALETFNAYRNADESVKNKNTLSTVTLPGGGTSMVTNEALLDAARGGQQRPMPPPMGQPQANKTPWISPEAQSGRIETFQSELRKAQAALANPNLPPMERARYIEDIAGIQREIRNAGGQQPSLAPNQAPQSAPSFGLPLQSVSEKERTSAENKAYETKLVEQTKADIQPTQAKQANISAAENAISLVEKALSHPGLGVATGLSGAIDPRNYVPGQVGKDYKAVQSQLEGKAFLSAFEQLKGGGAISEKEGEKAQQAIARMSLSQSEKEYRQGLKEYKEVMQVGLSRMKGEKPKDDAKPSDVPSQPMRGAVISGYKFKGGNPAVQSNWEKQ